MDGLYNHPQIPQIKAIHHPAFECLYLVKSGHLRWMAVDSCTNARAAYCVFRWGILLVSPHPFRWFPFFKNKTFCVCFIDNMKWTNDIFQLSAWPKFRDGCIRNKQPLTIGLQILHLIWFNLLFSFLPTNMYISMITGSISPASNNCSNQNWITRFCICPDKLLINGVKHYMIFVA